MTEETHGWRQRVAHVRAGTRLASAIAASVCTGLVLPSRLGFETRAVAAWDGFAAVALLLTWLTILTLRPAQIRTLAQREDPSRLASLVLVVVGAATSLLAVVVLLQASSKMGGSEKTQAVVLALSAVALAWFLIHTVFTLRYAHMFYDAPGEMAALDFPDMQDMPDYLDFAYFAFIVGMTAQTADVSIRDRDIRRTTLLHGILSFVFNTAVVALSISALGALL